jgi:DNA-binding PadR family transcriptional regulator
MSLTELEHTVAGVVWRLGPCTGYEVRRNFVSSGTPYWRASAGSIYPTLKRLLAGGVISAEQQPWGAQGRTLFSITPAGRAALEAWIAALDQVTGPAHDPMRTRVGFLDILSSKRQIEALSSAIAETEAALAEATALEEDEKSTAPWADWIAAKGSVHELKGRLSWLMEAEAICRARHDGDQGHPPPLRRGETND